MQSPTAWLLLAALVPMPVLAGTPAPAGNAPPASEIVYTKLPSGRYAAHVSGMLTTTCSRTIATEVAKIVKVESAQVDFEAEQLVLTVRINKTLKVSALRRALRRAAKKVNLGVNYTLGAIQYLP